MRPRPSHYPPSYGPYAWLMLKLRNGYLLTKLEEKVVAMIQFRNRKIG